jgi:hypothetical protein
MKGASTRRFAIRCFIASSALAALIAACLDWSVGSDAAAKDASTEEASSEAGEAGADAAADRNDGAQADANPIVVGCADGTREGFTDQARFPRVAGCAGIFDKLAPCPPPSVADPPAEIYGCSLCATGWHLCVSMDAGTQTTCPFSQVGFDYSELQTVGVDYTACKAQPGIFAGEGTFASSNFGCATSPDEQHAFGCGTDTGGHVGSTNVDCTGLLPKSTDCNSTRSDAAASCLSSGLLGCQGVSDAGQFPHWRGVMCCR